MSDDLKEFLSYLGYGALWAVGIAMAVVIAAALLFGPTVLANTLHNPTYYWLYLADIPVLGAIIGGAFWFEDNV